jgi:hypothetical protein
MNIDPAAVAVAGDQSTRSAGRSSNEGAAMTALLIGSARCSTDEQEITVLAGARGE